MRGFLQGKARGHTGPRRGAGARIGVLAVGMGLALAGAFAQQMGWWNLGVAPASDPAPLAGCTTLVRDQVHGQTKAEPCRMLAGAPASLDASARD